MTEQNGTGVAQPLLPQVTELVMTSGVVIWVRPMSLNDQRLIIEQTNKLYPLPQERDYKIPVPADQASFPEQTMLDVDAYKQAAGAIGVLRATYWIRAHIMTSVDFPEGVETIIARYLPEIQRKRKFLTLPEDDLEAVIFHSVITTPDDEKLIRDTLTKALPVEVSEVTSQLRIFRPVPIGGVDHPVSNGRSKTSRARVVQEQVS